MSSTRQLAAIMFTDIVGYTALMGRDEHKAFEILRKNRDIQKPLIKKYNGTWIKEMGDGVLASFHTVTDAVFCAAAIHQACETVEGLKLRIGIHLGEVIFENNDVFGDGVNIASRLQALASVGSTWVSESVYKNLANKKEITSEFVKEETLKNVSEPVKVYEISVKEIPGFLPDNIKVYQQNDPILKPGRKKLIYITAAGFLLVALAAWYTFFKNKTHEGSVNKTKSIAVLYFDNMTGDKEQEYFSDGLTEEIISRLSKIKGLHVISRTSVLPYKGQPINVKKIANDLNVDVLLEGSYRKSGNTAKITAQLINGKTDTHYWSEDFTRELKDIFELQSDIARAIAQKLEIEITPEANERINKKPTSNVEAYENFQKGYYFMYNKYFQTHRKEDFERSKQFFEKAIQLDPNYAEAYAGLAEAYDELRNSDAKNFPDSLYIFKQQLARKALQLNPNSSYVNTAMAWALAHGPRDAKFDSCVFYLKKAYTLDPADALNNWNLGSTLSFDLGLHSVALPLGLQAVKADPLNPVNYMSLGYHYVMLGKNEEAKQAFRKSLELTNESFHREFVVLYWLVYLGEFDLVEKRLQSKTDRNKYLLSLIAAQKGETAKIDTAFRKTLPVILATNRNKKIKEVIEQLEKIIDKSSTDIVSYDFLSTSYFFDAYREDPDFKRILEKAKKNQEFNLLKYGKIDIAE